MKGARALVRSAQRLLHAGNGPAVLCYHVVGAGTASPVDLDTKTFGSQVSWLRDKRAVVHVASWLGSASEPTLDRPKVLVTFDDAFENFYRVPFPLLREYGLGAMLFVPVGFVEREQGSPLGGAEGLAPMTWDQLREVSESGSVEIGSHSWTHPDFRSLEPRSLRRELVDSRDRLQEKLGVAVRSFCYPRALWSRRVEEVVGEVYDYAFVAGGGRVPSGRRFNPLRIPRIPIRRDMPASLEPVLRSSVWLEEWIADKVRRYLR